MTVFKVKRSDLPDTYFTSEATAKAWRAKKKGKCVEIVNVIDELNRLSAVVEQLCDLNEALRTNVNKSDNE